MKDSVTYQAILEEGEAMGVAKGAINEARKLLLLMGANRFGPPDRPTQATLKKLKDVQRLEKLGVRLLSVGSWQELLGTLPRRRGHRSGSS
jgi:hypothetical protein